MTNATTETSTAPALTTRQRLIDSMAHGMRRHGLHGTGLSEVLREAGAPKGVLYHHFPTGKTALAVAAIEASSVEIVGWLESVLAKYPDPLDAIEHWVRGASRLLSDSNYEAGCALATVALETTTDDREVRAALADAFATLRERIAQALAASGTANAPGLAALIVATYEGGLLQTRVANRGDIMTLASETLISLVRAQRGAA